MPCTVRPLGVTLLSLFCVFGTLMASLTAVMLLFPGSILVSLCAGECGGVCGVAYWVIAWVVRLAGAGGGAAGGGAWLRVCLGGFRFVALCRLVFLGCYGGHWCEWGGPQDRKSPPLTPSHRP